MSSTHFGVASQAARIDFIDQLLCDSSPGQSDNFVISAEFKFVVGRIEAEVLITGYVADPEHRNPGQHYLAPLVALQIPIEISHTPDRDDFPTAGLHAEQVAILEIRKLFCPLVELARNSQRAGGLSDAIINLKDSRPLLHQRDMIDTREFRQNLKMNLALAHTKLHWQARCDSGLEYFEAGKYRIPNSLVLFANLYSLARAIGVKEIRPRVQDSELYKRVVRDYRNDGVFSRPRRNKAMIDQETGGVRQLSDRNEFTVIIAKLKRAKFIENRF